MVSLMAVNAPENEADRRHGYRFGCEGIVDIPTAAERLGGVSVCTVFRRIAANKFRAGREGNRTVICIRSLNDYIASLEK